MTVWNFSCDDVENVLLTLRNRPRTSIITPVPLGRVGVIDVTPRHRQRHRPHITHHRLLTIPTRPLLTKNLQRRRAASLPTPASGGARKMAGVEMVYQRSRLQSLSAAPAGLSRDQYDVR